MHVSHYKQDKCHHQEHLYEVAEAPAPLGGLSRRTTILIVPCVSVVEIIAIPIVVGLLIGRRLVPSFRVEIGRPVIIIEFSVSFSSLAICIGIPILVGVDCYLWSVIVLPVTFVCCLVFVRYALMAVETTSLFWLVLVGVFSYRF